MGEKFRYWLPAPEAAEIIGISRDSIYRDIRRGTFPFRTEVIGGRIHVSARDIGLTPPKEESQKSEAPNQVESLAATA